jgi:hypothetical protein
MEQFNWSVIFHKLQKRFLLSTETDPVDLRKIAKEANILPLYVSMSGFYAVNDKGELLTFTFDRLAEPIIESDKRISNTVFFHGSQTYPELIPLVPIKPVDGRECPYCFGTGIAPNQPPRVNNLVCYCGGLGWIPNEK